MFSRRKVWIGAAVLVALGLILLWRFAQRDNESAVPVKEASRTASPRPAPMPALPELARAEPAAVIVTVPTKAPAANAAEIYRQAFASYHALSEAENELLADWKAEPDPAAAAALCDKLSPLTTLAHQAAALTNCDWGIKDVTLETRLPHLSEARNLARGLIWSAAHCRNSDAPGAGNDLEAALRLGQNVSQFLIGHLVNTAIENLTMEFIAAHAGTLPRASAIQVMALLSGDAYSESFYRAVETEAEAVRNSAARFATMPLEEFKRRLAEDALPPMQPADVMTACQQVADLEREYARMLGATDAEYQAFLTKLRAAEETNPFLKVLWPAMDRVEDKTRATIVQRAMTVAGLALAQDGPPAFARYPDPATGQPFVYRKTATGFELQSAYRHQDKPLVMTFTNP